MTMDEFWAIIDKSRAGWDDQRRDGNQRQQLHDLKELLSQLLPEEVVGFERHLERMFHRAYRWDLWHAAFLVGDGCSDDGFMDFRGWLISMGRPNYERALAAVESLAEIATAPGVECVFFEGFTAVPLEVYEKQTGKELDVKPQPSRPAGRRVPEAQFPTRFPKLWRKFGRI
jgi:uncharacterized protein DUF4240